MSIGARCERPRPTGLAIAMAVARLRSRRAELLEQSMASRPAAEFLVGWVCQAFPFQCSIRVLDQSAVPAAQASLT